MTDFDYDIKCKKELARSARYKKNGCKSKKCTLPSDYLTTKEKKAMNGEIKTYNMNKPWGYEFFKRQPLDIQGEYINRLVDKYHVSVSKIGKDMFGVSSSVLKNYLNKKGIATKNIKTCKNEEAWDAFLYGDEVEEDVTVEDTEDINEPIEAEIPKAEEKKQKVLPIQSGLLNMNGDVNTIAEYLIMALKQGQNYQMTINFMEV